MSTASLPGGRDLSPTSSLVRGLLQAASGTSGSYTRQTGFVSRHYQRTWFVESQGCDLGADSKSTRSNNMIRRSYISLGITGMPGYSINCRVIKTFQCR